MSYDLDMFALPPGMDVHTFFETRETDAELFSFTELTEAEYAFSRSIALKIASYDFGFRLFDGDRRHLELNNISNGIQIAFYKNSIAFMLPYTHRGEQAQAVFKKIWKYIAIIQAETGYVVYDPQLGEVLDLETDFEKPVQIYLSTMVKADDMIRSKPLPAE
ncbi:MAG: hypothetical protein ABI690_08070 [Chloroflexota bacterium]